MIIDNMEQGSTEWLEARSVRPTASNFKKIMTPKTLKFSSQAAAYAREIVDARISGVIPDNYQSAAMLDGTDREAEAREAYEYITDFKVAEVGIVYQNDEKLYSCSPDGLIMVGNVPVINHGLEMKNPIGTTQMEYIIHNVVPGVYIPQIQGSLWITELDFWDFFSHHPNYRHVLIRVHRDRKFIGALADAMDQFLNLIEVTRQRVSA